MYIPNRTITWQRIITLLSHLSAGILKLGGYPTHTTTPIIPHGCCTVNIASLIKFWNLIASYCSNIFHNMYMTYSYTLPLHNSLETCECYTTFHLINIGHKKLPGIFGGLESLREYVHRENFTILRISTIDRFNNLFERNPSGILDCAERSKKEDWFPS